MRGIIKRIARGCAAMIAGAVLALGASPAPAQMMMGGGADMWRAPLTRADVEDMAEYLDMTEEQKVVVDELFLAMETQYQTAQQKLREMLEAMQREAQETGDMSVWREAMPKFREFSEFQEGLREGYFDDVKLLLTEEQTAKWEDYERRLRRQQAASQPLPFISGMGVDLVAIVEEIELEPDVRGDVMSVLDQYARELDAAIVDMEEMGKELEEESMELFESGDFFGNMDAFDELWVKQRDAIIGVREIHTAYARRVAGRLPADAREEFERRFNETAIPKVYRESYVQTALDMAQGFEDLTPEQKTALDELEQAFRDELEGVNEKLAEATLEWEKGMRMRDVMGMQSPEATKEIGARKRDVEKRHYDRLREVLTEEQRARLPEREQRDWRRQTFGG